MGMKDTNDPLLDILKTSVITYADAYIARADTIGYNVSMTSADYFWGSNNVVGQFAYTMILAYEISGDISYKTQALNHLNYLLGSNSLNQTFISDVGDQPVANVFHLPSFHDGIAQVVPGLIPGGPNNNLEPSDVVLYDYIINEDPPPARRYLDSEFSFASNETTILESGVWGFVTGYFYQDQSECSAGNLINTWVGPSSGDWSDSALNWSLMRFPTRCHHVVIPSGKSVSISENSGATCLTLDVVTGGFLDMEGAGSLEVWAE